MSHFAMVAVGLACTVLVVALLLINRVVTRPYESIEEDEDA